MIPLAIALTVICLALVIALVVRGRDQQQERKMLLKDSDRERHELLQRIMHSEAEHNRELAGLHQSHREEIAQLNQARVEETANLLQRIQAPEQAATSHVADNAGPDPLPVPLDNDEEMFEVRRERVEQFLSG